MTEPICHALTAIGIVTGSADLEAERKRKFTQKDVTRAVKGVKEGVKATGAEIARVEVTRDKITIETGKAKPEPENVLPFDQWKARHAR